MDNNFITTYQFPEHLGDNQELLDSLITACGKQGQQTLVIAPCSSGKTYTMLVQVAQHLEGRSLVLAVPTVVQTLQCKSYADVETATGDSGHIPVGKSTAITYDKVVQLQGWSDEYLAKTTLIIDEVHMLVTEESYRGKAIKEVYASIRSILSCGGNVIYLTATPRRILFEEFFSMMGDLSSVSVMECIRTGKDGNAMPKIQQKRIELCRWNSKSSADKAALKVLETNYRKGKRSIMMFNQKSGIDKLMRRLNAVGIRTIRLTADDKGFWKEDIVDEMGIVRETTNHYVNDAYGSIVENEVLPDADVYLCTSVIEAGTNIKGIRLADGSIITPENLVAIYAARIYTQFDMDKIIQFLSRIRFTTNTGIVLARMPEDDEKEKKQKEAATKEFFVESVKAKILEEALMEQNFREMFGDSLQQMADLHDNRDRYTYRGAGGEVIINYVRVMDEVWRKYDKKVFFDIEHTSQYLESELGVPVKNTELKTIGKEKLENVKLDNETRAALHEALHSEKAYKNLEESTTPDMDIPEIRKLASLDDGIRAMKLAQPLIWIGTVQKDLVERYVTAKTEGEDIFVHIKDGKEAPGRGEGNQELMDYAICEALKRLSRQSNQSLKRLVEYAKGERELVTSVGDDAEKNRLRYLAETERFRYIKRMDEHGYFENSYQELFRIASVDNIRKLDLIQRECSYVYLNAASDNSDTMKKLKASPTRKVAEYLILRYPDRYLVNQHGRHIWKKNLQDCVLHQEDFQLIADNMEPSVNRMLSRNRKPCNYSIHTIYEHMFAMYQMGGSEFMAVPEKIRVRGLRKRLHKLKGIQDTNEE